LIDGEDSLSVFISYLRGIIKLLEVLKMSYNGWRNYETWLAGLYFGGGDWRDFVETVLLGEEEDEEITEAKKIEMLSLYFKDFIEEEADMAGLTGFLNDLLTSAISEIDFTELAATFLDD
jgi:hypothetical protein